ncbi:MAG: sulfatase-like hydrolase/transferase, partial [Thermoplasmatales archaeon]|nr:sulfatase-like hydrolase/transferase [Thermoplasmatales archaeon]
NLEEIMSRFPPKFEIVRPIILEIYKNGPTMAGILKGYGYSTAAFHSNPLLSRYYNFGKDFNSFYDSFSFEKLRRYAVRRKIAGTLKKMKLYWFTRYAYEMVHSSGVPFERAESINQKVVSWLKEYKKQFFVWIHYMDVHFPYKPLKEFQLGPKPISSREMTSLNSRMFTRPKEILKEEMGELIDLYDGEIRYTDYAIKSLLDEMSRKGILNDTALIITADHGDEFGEHGDFAHHHGKLYEESIHVPLIIANSEYKNIKIDEPVSLIDIAPTVLHLLDIPASESFQGRSLIPIIRGERKSSGVISESLQKGKRNISYRTKEWKYILNEVESRRELYNTINDPEEKENLYEKERKRAKEFELKVTKHTAKQGEKIEGLTDEKERIKGRIKRLRGISKI